MNTEQAYKIVGVEPGASEEEVRTAYRRQVKKLHPDVNKAPGAHEQFVILSEAYEYLLKGKSVLILEPTYEEDIAEQQRREQLQKEKRARWEKRQQEKALQRFRALQKIFSGLNILVACCFMYAGLLAIDYALPPSEYQEEVLEVRKVYEGSGSRGGRAMTYSYDDVYFRNFKIRVLKGEGPYIAGLATVFTTPLLQIVRKAEVIGKETPLVLEPAYGFYSTFGFLIPLLLALGIAYYRLPSQGDVRLTIGVLILFIGFFHLVLVLSL